MSSGSGTGWRPTGGRSTTSQRSDGGGGHPELGRRWNFPDKIVRALENASDPMAGHPFCQLGGIIHLASLLADTPSDDPAILDTLPAEVVDTLRLSREWMTVRFPSHASFSAEP